MIYLHVHLQSYPALFISFDCQKEFIYESVEFIKEKKIQPIIKIKF